jgi:hypothetical protein
MNQFEEFGVYRTLLKAIEKYGGKDCNVVELHCTGGDFADFLNRNDHKNYRGIAEDVSAAKKKVPELSRRFHTKLPKSAKQDLVIIAKDISGVDITTFDGIESGNAIALITKGASWENVCYKLNQYFRPGASTIEHPNGWFVTYGIAA